MHLQPRIIKYLKPRACCFNINVAQPGGCPDLLICYRGKFLGIEVKDGSDREGKRQVVVLYRIKLHKGYAIVARNLRDVMDLLEEVDRDIDERKMI